MVAIGLTCFCREMTQRAGDERPFLNSSWAGIFFNEFPLKILDLLLLYWDNQIILTFNFRGSKSPIKFPATIKLVGNSIVNC